MTIEEVERALRESDDDIFDYFAPWEGEWICYIYADVVLDQLFELFDAQPDGNPFAIIDEFKNRLELYDDRHLKEDMMISVWYYTLDMLEWYLKEIENELSRENRDTSGSEVGC